MKPYARVVIVGLFLGLIGCSPAALGNDVAANTVCDFRDNQNIELGEVIKLEAELVLVSGQLLFLPPFDCAPDGYLKVVSVGEQQYNGISLIGYLATRNEIAGSTETPALSGTFEVVLQRNAIRPQVLEAMVVELESAREIHIPRREFEQRFGGAENPTQ